MKTIGYFYSAHSAFAHVGMARLREIAAAAGRRIDHRPFDLHAAMAAQGISAFSARSPVHVRYFFRREIWRWAEYRGAPLGPGRPSTHSNDYTPANLMLTAAIGLGLDVDALAQAVLAAHWVEDADLSDWRRIEAIAAALGLDAPALIAAAQTPQTRATLDATTAEAVARHVFGSPTYVVDGDMFYGQDRLELVERALATPFGPSPD